VSGDGNAARRYHDEALSVLRRCGRTKLLAIALLQAGGGRCRAGDLQAGRSLVEEAWALSMALGDVGVCDHCATYLVVIAFRAGRMAEAITYARQAIETSCRHGTLTAELMALHWLAALLLLDSQIEAGRAATLRAFELSCAFGNEGLRFLIEQLALILAMQGET